MSRSGIITLGLMAAVVIIALLYIVFRDQSVVQKNNSTPAATALLPEGEADTFKNLAGEPISVAEDFGSIIVVSSWASWCPQCAADFPKLGEVAAEFKDQDVVVYAVNRGEDPYSAERYLATITRPEHVQFILDQSDYYFKNSAGYAMPETIVYNQKGEVVLQQRGELKLEELRATLQLQVDK
ncbi:MAG: TlpA disulfide reductase family protein [Patescibacteria group bacterium]